MGACLECARPDVIGPYGVGVAAGKDKKTARKLVAACRAQNQWRQATTWTVLETALPLAEKKKSRKVLMLRHPDWHPGVVGIVASWIKEKFNRPTFICGKKPNGDWTGSGRSIKARAEERKPEQAMLPESEPEALYDMGAKLIEAQRKNWISKGGGHKMAGGVSFLNSRKFQLQTWLEDDCGLKEEDLKPSIELCAPASLFSPAQWGAFHERLAPFGQDNPCPSLMVERAELLGIRPRARIRGDIAGLAGPDGYQPKAKNKTQATMLFLAPPLPELWAYEGQFQDLANCDPGVEPPLAYNFQIQQCRPLANRNR